MHQERLTGGEGLAVGEEEQIAIEDISLSHNQIIGERR
jgi:hypothetical protein